MIALPPALVLTRWFQRRSSVAQLKVRNTISGVTAQMAESVAGMTVIQAFNRERAFQAQFDELNEANRTSNVVAQRLFSVFFPSIELLGVISTCAVLLVGAQLLADGSLTIGALITETYLLQLVFQPLQELSDVYADLQSASAAMIKITSVLDTEADITDRPHAEPAPHLNGRIDLDAVSFAYGQTTVLRDIEIHAAAGECIALVGQSGGGKSTLAKLIARFATARTGSLVVGPYPERCLLPIQLSGTRAR